MHKSIVAISTGLIGSANAFWRMECPAPIGVARLDPIVDFGKPANHVHSIHGSSGFTDKSGTSNLLGGSCTSCRVTQDKSAYWTPTLYFEDASTGKFELVKQVGGMLAYYLLYGDNIKAYPTDFRMLAGDMRRRTYTAGNPSEPDPAKSSWNVKSETDQSMLEQRALGFNCLNYDKQPEGTLYRHYMPEKSYLDANCKNGIRLELMFPSCWNGKDLDSKNHKDHVAYPDLVMTGKCPAEYPVRLPSLMYETIWDTYAYTGRNGRFVFSYGDTTGYGYHGDFIMGWEEDFLQSAVNTCTNESGRIQDCPLFNVVSEEEAKTCKMPSSALTGVLSTEDVFGPVSGLPGGVKITFSDGEHSGHDEEPSSDLPKPTLTYIPGEKPSNSASPLPGQVFKQTGGSLADMPAADPAPATTLLPTTSGPAGAAFIEVPTTTQGPDVAAAGVNGEGVSYYSTQYTTNGNIVSKIYWEEKIVYVTDDIEVTETVTVTSNVAAPTDGGYARRRRHAHAHAAHQH